MSALYMPLLAELGASVRLATINMALLAELPLGTGQPFIEH